LGVQINLWLHILGSTAVITMVCVPVAHDWVTSACNRSSRLAQGPVTHGHGPYLRIRRAFLASRISADKTARHP
jgi:hypothetical protein